MRGRVTGAVLALMLAVLPATPAAADVAGPDGVKPDLAGPGPVLLAALGFLLIGLGLSALLVRPADRYPGRRPGTPRRPA